MAKYIISDKDREALRLYAEREKTRPNAPPLNEGVKRENVQTNDVYVARTKSGGIPALTLSPGTGTGSDVYDIVGVALCDIYRVDEVAIETESGPQFILLEEDATAYNLATSAVPEETWIVVVRDNFGCYLAVHRGEGGTDGTAIVRVTSGTPDEDGNYPAVVTTYSSGGVGGEGWADQDTVVAKPANDGEVLVSGERYIARADTNTGDDPPVYVAFGGSGDLLLVKQVGGSSYPTELLEFATCAVTDEGGGTTRVTPNVSVLGSVGMMHGSYQDAGWKNFGTISFGTSNGSGDGPVASGSRVELVLSGGLLTRLVYTDGTGADDPPPVWMSHITYNSGTDETTFTVTNVFSFGANDVRMIAGGSNARFQCRGSDGDTGTDKIGNVFVGGICTSVSEGEQEIDGGNTEDI